MPIEDGGDGYFFPAQGFGDGFEGEVPLLFGGEENGRLGGEARDDVLLKAVLVKVRLCERSGLGTLSTAMGWPDEVPCCARAVVVAEKLTFCCFK